MRSEPTEIRASVVVVNYNGGRAVIECLDSLFVDRERGRELLVVDNASSDGSREALLDRAATAGSFQLILAEHNLGYAGAVNLALEIARGEYVAVLNMDIVVSPNWLRPLLDFLDDNPEVGAVNPLLALADGERINALGQEVHVSGLGFSRALGESCSGLALDPVPVSGIQGAAFVVRRELLDKLDGMNAAGFLYHEDVNLSWLLRLLGFQLFCLPTSVVRHEYSLSMYPHKLHLLERNRLALLATYPTLPTLLLVSPWLLATEAMVWGYALLKGPRFLRAKATGYGWLFRHRLTIISRRRWAQSIRTVDDRAILRHLRFRYDWSQFLTLVRERGTTTPQSARHRDSRESSSPP